MYPNAIANTKPRFYYNMQSGYITGYNTAKRLRLICIRPEFCLQCVCKSCNGGILQ